MKNGWLIVIALACVIFIFSPPAVFLYCRNTGQQAYTRGKACSKQHQYQQAVVEYSTAIRFLPGDPKPLYARGSSYARLKQYDAAINDYNAALAMINRSKHPSVTRQGAIYYWRGQVYSMKGMYSQAVADFEHAIATFPDSVSVCNNLAWLLATCPNPAIRNGKRAVELAREACMHSNWKDADYIDTLGAAYAETGQFTEAVKWEQQAIKLSKNSADSKEFTDRVHLFQSEKPYREPLLQEFRH